MLPIIHSGQSFSQSVNQSLKDSHEHYFVSEFLKKEGVDFLEETNVSEPAIQIQIDKLEEDAKNLYLKTRGADHNFGQIIRKFHSNVFKVMKSKDTSESQHEKLEHLLITYGLSQNMTQLTQRSCLEAIGGDDSSHFVDLVNKWALRFEEVSWKSDWPRKPVVAQWFEYVLKNTPVRFNEELEHKLQGIVHKHAPLMPLKMDTGYRGLPQGHQWSSLFPGANLPAVFKVVSIESTDKKESDIEKSTALKLKVSFPSARDQGLVQKFTAGQHLAILNLKDSSKVFQEKLKIENEKVFESIEALNQSDTLKNAKYCHYTVASPTAGDEDGTLTFLLRVKRHDPESTSHYLAHLKEGDCGLTALPSSNFTRAPNPQTPCLMFGQGTSASLAMTIISSRISKITTLDSSVPQVISYEPLHLVMNYRYRAQEFGMNEISQFALHKSNNIKFRALVGEHAFLRPHIQKKESQSAFKAMIAYLRESKANIKYVFSEEFKKHNSMSSESLLTDIKTNLDRKIEFLSHPSGSYITGQLMRERHEFDDILGLIFNPDTHIFFSGYQNAAETTIKSIKKAAEFHGVSVQKIEEAIIMAQQEGRFHVEGTVASGVTTGYQGN